MQVGTNMVWMHFKSNGENKEPISCISGIIPTEKGVIQVNCYSHSEEYSTYEATFQSVASSVSPEPGLVYKPKLSGSLLPLATGIDWGKVIGRVIIAALFGVIIAIFKVSRKKKTNK